MATTFLEPGGDADFLVGTTNGFWGIINAAPSIATDFVHGGHQKSIKYRTGNFDIVKTIAGVARDAGTRISFYIYINALPNATGKFFQLTTAGDGASLAIQITSGGVLQLRNDAGGVQIGTDGATLSTSQWYRISLAYTITSTSVNRFELFVNGVSSISITNATLTTIVTSKAGWGNSSGNATFDIRTSDHYIDNSSSLTDPGNIWVTAKRPNANGTTNGFTTSGSPSGGTGTGNAPYVSERPLDTGALVSKVGVGSAVTEEYNIESKSTGDINISTATIVDWLAWWSMSSLVGETLTTIFNGSTSTQAITSTATLYTKIVGSTTYPAGTGADIGIITTTALTTVSLYECGVIVAYIPAVATNTGNMLLVF
jgi:hypothetical protein